MEQYIDKEHFDDEKTKQSYQRILNRSCRANSIDSQSSGTGSDTENERNIDPFQVELYVSSIQDKINQFLKDTTMYACFKFPYARNKIKPIRTKITSMKLELASNCCMLVSINYDEIKIKSKRSFDDCEISIYVLQTETGEIVQTISGLLGSEKPSPTQKTKKFMQITNTVMGDGLSGLRPDKPLDFEKEQSSFSKCDCIDSNELVIHEELQDKKKVSFTITSDLDISEVSMWFKVGYLDYTCE